MKICLVGLSHKTAPVEIREKIAFSSPQKLEEGTMLFMKQEDVRECVILSTCNRVEMYLTVNDSCDWRGLVVDRFSEYHGLRREDFMPHLYFKEDAEAIKHVFRVASGLDSMVLGEPQITGQLKEAYGFAASRNATGFVLNRLMHNAFSVAKNVRTNTRIGSFAVSISYAAVELAKKIFETLDNRKAMLIGAGEMAELAAKHLLTNGISEIIVANRTYERACSLSKEFNGTACDFAEFPERLKDVDIVISSTGAPNFIITPEKIKDVLRIRRNRPMFLIDIAVPRDIDPRVNELDNVYVYDIDDLQNVADSNLAERQKEAVKAEKIVEEEIAEFENWIRSLETKPLLLNLRRYCEDIKENELQTAKQKLPELSEKELKVMEAMMNAVVNKILHKPSIFIRQLTSQENSYVYLDTIKQMFDLKTEGENDDEKNH